MQLKIPVLTALVILTTVIAIPLTTHPVKAAVGFGVDDPGNVWTPYGPWGVGTSGSANPVRNLQMNFYSSETVEFSNFELGKIDVVDWEAPKSRFNSWDNNPDLLLAPTQGQFGDFGLYFNGASSHWKAWGCDWAANFDTVSNANPTVANPQVYNNTRQVDALGIACDVNMRQGFAHLFDRPRWVVDGILQGTAQALADDSPPAKAPAGSSLAEQCSWDKLFPTCISAYRLAPNPGGFAAPGSPDFCAAADHMIHAGVATGKQAGSCILTGVKAGVFASPMRIMIRSDKPPRLQFGNGFMNALNQLFGGQAASPTYGNIRQIGFPIVFSEPPESPLDDWEAYTYGYGLPGPFPDHFFPFYNSQFATDYCGGIAEPEPNNVQFVCNTKLDSLTLTAATTPDLPTFSIATTNVMSGLGHIAAALPVYADGVRLGALRSVAGLVNQRGTGYTNAATMSYAHKGTYTPVDPKYAFGGGDSTTLRWGQASGTLELNLFHVQTVWEFNVIGEVYDTLFSASPVQLDKVYCNMCTTAPTITPFVPGDTLYDVNLRQNLRFHDGTAVTAHDVAFSALNLARFSANLGGGVQLLRGVKEISPTEVYIEWQGQSISYPPDMEFVVMPAHLWEDTSAAAPTRCAINCTWGVAQGTAGEANLVATNIHPVAASKQASTYDPIAQGTFVGSAAWACVSVFSEDLGKVGAGCAKNSDGTTRSGQAIPIGGTLLLQAFDFTNKAGNTDPFNQYMRTYNPSFGSITWVACKNSLTGEQRAFPKTPGCPGQQPTPPSCPVPSASCWDTVGDIATSAQSGQYQEWNYAQQGKTGTVTTADLSNVAGCYGANPATPLNSTHITLTCKVTNYNYWHRSTFETSSGIVSGEVAIVAKHVDDTFISPYWPWDTTVLENITPFVP